MGVIGGRLRRSPWGAFALLFLGVRVCFGVVVIGSGCVFLGVWGLLFLGVGGDFGVRCGGAVLSFG